MDTAKAVTMEAGNWSIGQRIASHRARRGLTQEDLAGLVGISLSMMKKIESGDRAVTRFSQLVLFAQALRVKDLRDLTGVPFALMPDGLRGHPAVDDVYSALMERGQPTGEPPNLDDVDAAIERAWQVWHQPSAFRYEAVGQQLPGLIRQTQSAVPVLGGKECRDALRLASKLYHLTQSWTRGVGEYELSLVAADRAVTCALEADDPDLAASAAWNLGMALLAQGRAGQSLAVARRAIDDLRPHLERPTKARLAAYGGLHLLAATGAAREDEAGQARAFLDVADRAARKTGETNHFRMVFGPTNVALHRLSTALELGRTNDALELAERIAIDGTPSVGRRITFHLDSARCYLRARNDVAAVHMIQHIHRDSPEEVRYSSQLREALRLLMGRAKPAVRTELQPLLAAAGLPD